MVVTTFIARVVDGLILCESWDSGGEAPDGQNQKNKAKMLLKKLQNTDPRCSVDSGSCVFHYVIDNGIIYMVITDRSYPKVIAFRFLEDIKALFIQSLMADWGQGVDIRSRIETIDKPYHFIRFDRTIAKKKQEYRDPQSSGSMQRLNNSLQEVQSIMSRNIEDMLQRGENLEEVGQKSSALRDASMQYKDLSKQLHMQALMKKWGPIAAIGFVVLLFIYIQFF